MKPIVKKIYNENNDFQRMEVLKRNRKKRSRYKEFFVEGVKPINSAIENNWHIKSFAYSTERPLSKWAKEILENSSAQTHFELPLRLMEKLSDKEEDISELIAVVSIPEDDLSRIKIKDNMLVVIFDRPSSHGNFGTLIRSCEALKVDGVIVTGHSIDIYDPKTIRASMGALFAVPTIRLQSHNQLLPWFDRMRQKYNDFKIIGSSSKGDRFIMESDLSKGPMALVIGNETYGLSHSYKQLCDFLVKIPMY
ncbi:MAG: TrmH family RNA methyltransferase, partial [Caldicoprobacterales bacterium]